VAEESVPKTGEVLVVVGPEGGITDDELRALRAAGAVEARLGDSVLRSSTAGVAALAVICAATRWRTEP
jgi:16S rRNA (uracil1498-N3)-methyltransferase